MVPISRVFHHRLRSENDYSCTWCSNICPYASFILVYTLGAGGTPFYVQTSKIRGAAFKSSINSHNFQTNENSLHAENHNSTNTASFCSFYIEERVLRQSDWFYNRIRSHQSGWLQMPKTEKWDWFSAEQWHESRTLFENELYANLRNKEKEEWNRWPTKDGFSALGNDHLDFLAVFVSLSTFEKIILINNISFRSEKWSNGSRV